MNWLDRLSVRELRALRFLREKPQGASLKEISDSLGIPPSSAHGLMQKLLALNLVDKNGQGKYYLTKAGEQVLEKIGAIITG
ncbi:hypothetical protein APE_0720a [Aeropyrum pernix ovoid virus 1]|uniref:HTH iclR-type domain-containing protein n=2 Tax=root TaxID=1 RepID=Q05E57_AERPE|nr:helix-turn-helix domain-containing protein [Aeropyrum pernix]YP_009177655.1 helix-turn-helix domain-containing protein [Aeropyrum pernix ovoid virus 1]BAF34744.1 hypothetical protein APE_0720a [Aeropyrum pernix ovoid virus 1] [Aeropyrum pernix K1]CCD22145.1 TPA: hypothetical protein [Aeropyrum pernix ovoid virus 1]